MGLFTRLWGTVEIGWLDTHEILQELEEPCSTSTSEMGYSVKRKLGILVLKRQTRKNPKCGTG